MSVCVQMCVSVSECVCECVCLNVFEYMSECVCVPLQMDMRLMGFLQ